MKRFIAIAAAVAVAGAANATELQTNTLTVNAQVNLISGFVVAPLGPALDYEATRFQLAAKGVNSADIASISGIYNGADSWGIEVSSGGNFMLADQAGQLTGFRYGVEWTSNTTNEIETIADVSMGWFLKANNEADPDISAAWDGSADAGAVTVKNGASKMAEYTGKLVATAQGGQQWTTGLYTDDLTVTFSSN